MKTCTNLLEWWKKVEFVMKPYKTGCTEAVSLFSACYLLFSSALWTVAKMAFSQKLVFLSQMLHFFKFWIQKLKLYFMCTASKQVLNVWLCCKTWEWIYFYSISSFLPFIIFPMVMEISFLQPLRLKFPIVIGFYAFLKVQCPISCRAFPVCFENFPQWLLSYLSTITQLYPSKQGDIFDCNFISSSEVL